MPLTELIGCKCLEITSVPFALTERARLACLDGMFQKVLRQSSEGCWEVLPGRNCAHCVVPPPPRFLPLRQAYFGRILEMNPQHASVSQAVAVDWRSTVP